MGNGFLRVYANPYGHIDHNGQPAAALAIEGAPGRYVGATLVVKGTDPKLHEMLFEGKRAAHRSFEFDGGPVLVPCTPYYVHALTRGEIFPADAETAREVGIAKFTPPDVALAAARDHAIANYVDHYGKRPAFADPPAPVAASAAPTEPAVVPEPPAPAAVSSAPVAPHGGE